MDYLIMIGQLILSLSILIVLHEMGHFIPAKLFGTRVEKFYLFFDPWFSLFKVKKGETEYGIGWLPLGGYVKISGMIDESFDMEAMKEEPKEWEFRSKPAWQRLIIMLGGVTVNFILGFLIFAMVLFAWGEEYLPNEEAKFGIYADSLGMELGLMHQDKVISVGDRMVDKFNDRIILQEIVINNADKIVVERAGQQKTLPVPPSMVNELSSFKNKDRSLYLPFFPFELDKVMDDGNAKKAGLQKDDHVIAINNIQTPSYFHFVKAVRKYNDKKTTIDVIRNRDTLSLPITFNENAKIGVQPYMGDHFFKFKQQEYSMMQALPAGTIKGVKFLETQIKAFGQMFRGKIKASESLGGFKSIANMFDVTWNWERFWYMTAVLSLILAFMNLLPIPALDGGHVMFLLYEIVSGKKPSDKFMEYATMVGFFLVFGLLIYANVMDFLR